MKKQIIFSDFILNIIASAVPIIVMQIVILPIMGIRLGDKGFGLAVTLISMATLFSLPFGSVLNNIRLLMDNEYRKNNINGDFKILLTASIIINAIFMIIGTIYYEGRFSPVSIILVVLFSCLNILREYLIVSFRIKINYRAILLNNLMLSVGYLFGLLLFYFIEYWQIIFVSGSGFSLFYILKNSNIIYESFSKTKLFGKTLYNSLVLFFSVLMKTALTYADKLLLFPLLGSTGVSIYYTATLMGKILSLIFTPISSVMLSYLAKMSKIKIKQFVIIVTLTTVFGLIGYFIIIFISEPILNLLYPSWANESLKLINVTTATAILGVISSVINPVILRFNHINWQIVINLVNLILYTILVFVFYSFYGLIGFCFAMLIANIIKLLLMISVFIFGYINREKPEFDSK